MIEKVLTASHQLVEKNEKYPKLIKILKVDFSYFEWSSDTIKLVV